MQEQFSQLRLENTAMSELGLGIGINTGEAIVGNVGSDQLMDYTVIGNTPNIARRLQERALPGQILIGHRAYKALEETIKAREIEPLHLKGISEPVRAYEVLAVEELVV